MKYLIISLFILIPGIIHAQIYYYDFSPDEILYSDGNSTITDFYLDMNNDSVTEIYISVWDDEGNWFQADLDLFAAVPSGETNAEVISNSDCEALYLDQANSISGSSDFTNLNPCMVDGSGIFCIHEPAVPNIWGQWPGMMDKYLGIRFLIGANLHYGWIRIDVSADCDSLIMKDFAWNTQPDSMILAGQTVNYVDENNFSAGSLNYFRNQLHFISSSSGNYILEVYSIEGKLLLAEKINTEAVNLDFLTAGTYLAVVSGENKKSQLKFAKY